MSYGVPAVPTGLLHWAVVAQLGHSASVKQTWPVQPLVKAAISLYGATVVELALWVKPTRTTLPPLLPVSVMLKHLTGPVYSLLTGAVPPDESSSMPMPHPHFALVGSTTVVPLMQQLPVVQMLDGMGVVHEEPSP